MKTRAALLDIDGALVDSNYQHALAWYRAFRLHGITVPVCASTAMSSAPRSMPCTCR